ncbi:hypothetical protein [Halogeometricum luteum]
MSEGGTTDRPASEVRTDGGAPEESDADDPDWEMAPDSEAEFEPDADRRELLREVAEEVYGDSSESRQLSAVLYRVSDLYDPDEDTSPEEIYLNVRHIMDIKEQGGLRTE